MPKGHVRADTWAHTHFTHNILRFLLTHNSYTCFFPQNTLLDLFLSLVLEQLCWNRITLPINVEKKHFLWRKLWLSSWHGCCCCLERSDLIPFLFFFSPIATETKVLSSDKNKKKENRKLVCLSWAYSGSRDFLSTYKVFRVFVCGRLAQWMGELMYGMCIRKHAVTWISIVLLTQFERRKKNIFMLACKAKQGNYSFRKSLFLVSVRKLCDKNANNKPAGFCFA